ncbi:hypothetical protein H8E88_35570 [candidate division KSB1 bacterium]|nr:hypothetical protein [candidate division KSB1 bacterium]
MRKFLIAFGLIWIFIWSAFGLFLGVMKHDEWLANMQAAAAGSDLPQFLQSMTWWKGLTGTHTHALCFSFLMILVALIMPEMKYSEKLKKTIGILLTSGVVINGIFGFIGIQLLIGLGAVLILVSVLMSFIGIIQNVNN